MIKSGYVIAGFETLGTIIDKFIDDSKGRYDNNFSREDISRFLSSTCSGFLHSFGQNFTGKKKLERHVKNERAVFEKCKSWGLFEQGGFIADSGGFQASVGRLEAYEVEELITLYHQFLIEHHDILDRAFILDLPPGPGCKLFSNFNDVYDINLRTYTMAKELPDEVRGKMIYIHHFRTPRLWDIYTKILRENDMFESFNHFGTGGIVANMSSDASIPCIIYVLPMIPLLNECIKHGRDKLDFHILGGANFRDILFYELFRIHVMNIHSIELNITYDSSGLYKGLMVARYIYVVNDNNVFKKVDIRSTNLGKRFQGDTTVEERVKEALNRMARKYGFKTIDMPEIYDTSTSDSLFKELQILTTDGNDISQKGTFFEEVKVYTMLYMIDQFSEVQEAMRNIAAEIYPQYESGELDVFTQNILHVTRDLNNGKMTKKQKAKSFSVVRSLDMLSNLDEDYCKYLVSRFLGKDEFIELDRHQRILPI